MHYTEPATQGHELDLNDEGDGLECMNCGKPFEKEAHAEGESCEY